MYSQDLWLRFYPRRVIPQHTGNLNSDDWGLNAVQKHAKTLDCTAMLFSFDPFKMCGIAGFLPSLPIIPQRVFGLQPSLVSPLTGSIVALNKFWFLTIRNSELDHLHLVYLEHFKDPWLLGKSLFFLGAFHIFCMCVCTIHLLAKQKTLIFFLWQKLNFAAGYSINIYIYVFRHIANN